MGRLTARVVRKSPERTNDNTVDRFLEFLAQRALPSNSAWRPTRTKMESIRNLPEFGYEFTGVIEFTKMGGRQKPDLIAKEKRVILGRLIKAGNFAKWGKGRKWAVSEIPNLAEPPEMPDLPDGEPEDDVETLTVGPGGVLRVPTDLEEGMSVDLLNRDDGSMLLRPIPVNAKANLLDDEQEIQDVASRPMHPAHADRGAGGDEQEIEDVAPRPAPATTSSYDTDELSKMMRLAGDPTRMSILNVLRHGERNVSELCHDLGDMTQPAISHHLTLLRMTSLVEPRRAGKHRYYSLTPRGRGLIENVAKVAR